MPEAYIVEAVRTPVGRRKGGLSSVPPADLGAHVLRTLMERSGADPAVVEDVVFGWPTSRWSSGCKGPDR